MAAPSQEDLAVELKQIKEMVRFLAVPRELQIAIVK